MQKFKVLLYISLLFISFSTTVSSADNSEVLKEVTVSDIYNPTNKNQALQLMTQILGTILPDAVLEAQLPAISLTFFSAITLITTLLWNQCGTKSVMPAAATTFGLLALGHQTSILPNLHTKLSNYLESLIEKSNKAHEKKSESTLNKVIKIAHDNHISQDISMRVIWHGTLAEDLSPKEKLFELGVDNPPQIESDHPKISTTISKILSLLNGVSSIIDKLPSEIKVLSILGAILYAYQSYNGLPYNIIFTIKQLAMITIESTLISQAYQYLFYATNSRYESKLKTLAAWQKREHSDQYILEVFEILGKQAQQAKIAGPQK